MKLLTSNFSPKYHPWTKKIWGSNHKFKKLLIVQRAIHKIITEYYRYQEDDTKFNFCFLPFHVILTYPYMSKSLTDFWIPTTSTHQRVLAAPAWGWSFWETSPVFLQSHLLPFVPCHRLTQDLRQKWSRSLTFQHCTWWLLTEINVSTWAPTLPLTQQHITDCLLGLQLG